MVTKTEFMSRQGEVVKSPISRRRKTLKTATCPMCGVTYKGKNAGRAVSGCMSYHKYPNKGFVSGVGDVKE